MDALSEVLPQCLAWFNQFLFESEYLLYFSEVLFSEA